MRYVTLPNGKTCSIKTYRNAWETLKTLDPHMVIDDFGYEGKTAAYILHRLREGMQDRINRHIPGHKTGRKKDPCYQAWLHKVSWAMKNRIVTRFHDIPHEYRDRLKHRIFDE